MKIWGKTDIGKTRYENQDNFICQEITENIVAFCVCDGMGGPNGGMIASKYASREFIHALKNTLKLDLNENEAKNLVNEAVFIANNFVYDMARGDINLQEMGTTLVGGFLIGNDVYIANVGDSRAYYINSDKILQITKDHSLVQHLLDNGEISEDEKKTHPKKNYITRAVGVAREIAIDVFKITLQENEYLLLCSDGLYNLIDDEKIKQTVLSQQNIDEKCEIMIQDANENGGTDNITAIILEF